MPQRSFLPVFTAILILFFVAEIHIFLGVFWAQLVRSNIEHCLFFFLLNYLFVFRSYFCFYCSPESSDPSFLSPNSFFLDAPSQLYKRLCPSVGPSVRRSVCPVLFSKVHLVPCIRPCFFGLQVKVRSSLLFSPCRHALSSYSLFHVFSAT